MRDSKIEQENFYKAAKFYLKKGFSIFPVAYGTKRPIVEWGRFCQRRISAEEVDDWWGRELYNIGVVCGQISGIVVMDVDDLEKFKRFCERHGLKLPSACPVVKTRRGLHVYAKYPADTEITKLDFSEVAGFEIRGDRHFVVAPPSIFREFDDESGQIVGEHRYEWLSLNGIALSLENFDPAPFEAIAEFIEAAKREEEVHLSKVVAAEIEQREFAVEAGEGDPLFSDFTVEEFQRYHEFMRSRGIKTGNLRIYEYHERYAAYFQHQCLSPTHKPDGSPDIHPSASTVLLRNGIVIFRCHKCYDTGDREKKRNAFLPWLQLLKEFRPDKAKQQQLLKLSLNHDDKPSDWEMALHLTELVKDSLCWVREWGWMMWDGKRWKKITEDEAVCLAQQVLTEFYAQMLQKHLATENYKRWVNFLVRAKSHRAAKQALNSAILQLRVDIQEFDVDPYLLNCQNGVIDLRTGTLIPHDPKLKLTKICNASYYPDAYAPTWEKFLQDVFLGDEELIAFMQRTLGYSITGDTSEQVLFIAWGLGSNGKSTLFRTIQRILGDYARSVAKDALMKRNGKGDTHPTAIANLVGCRFALLQETEEGRQLDASAIKWVTGGDKITARFLYRDYFEFFPEFKVWLVTNYKPVVTDTTYAFWRRLILIPFRAIFDEKQRDREMPNKLWAERDGILTWLVQGCLRWQEDGLNPPKVIVEATKEYQTEMDVLQQWLEECCVADPRAETPFADLYASYTEWCKERDETPVSKRKFGERLSEKGYESVLIRDSVLGKPVKARRGVRLKQKTDNGCGGAVTVVTDVTVPIGNFPVASSDKKVSDVNGYISYAPPLLTLTRSEKEMPENLANQTINQHGELEGACIANSDEDDDDDFKLNLLLRLGFPF
jgi:putative DNA primase/helicase